MIEKLIFASRISEIDTTSRKVRGAFGKSALNSDPNLQLIFSELDVSSKQLADSIKRTRDESELDEKDNVRDDKFRAFFYLVFGLLFYPDAEVKAAARIVMNEIEKYGLETVGESYATESSHVSSLLGDLRKSKVKKAIDLLPGVAPLVAELDAAESDFEQTSLVQEEEKAKAGKLKSATVLKKEVVGIINDRLVDYLKVMLLVNKATFGDFARTVARIIADSNSTVRKRRGKRGKGE